VSRDRVVGSPTETPDLVTLLVRGSVLFGLLLATVHMGLVDTGVMAAITGVLAAVGLVASARQTGRGTVVASGLLSLAGTGIAATAALTLLGAYETFSILTVPIPRLLARSITFALLSAAAVVAIAGATALPRGPTLARGTTPATTIMAVVVLVQSLLGTVLLWDLLVRNLAALGFGPVEFLLRAVFGIGTVGPAPGAFLFLLACTAVLVGFTRIHLATDPPDALGQWLLVFGALAGGLAVPATVATHFGAFTALVSTVPLGYPLLVLFTTNVLIRLLLVGTLVLTAGFLTVRRFDAASPGTVLRPAVAVVVALLPPLLLAIAAELFHIVEYFLDRAPPDAANIVRDMLSVSGSVPLLVGASTTATIFLALSIAILSLLVDADRLAASTLPATLAGLGTIVAGVAAVIHSPPAFAGVLAVAAGLLAWDLGTYGRSIADTVGTNGDSRVTIVRSGALAGVLSIATIVSYGVAFLVDQEFTPTTPQAGGAALLVLVGVLLVLGSLRR